MEKSIGRKKIRVRLYLAFCLFIMILVAFQAKASDKKMPAMACKTFSSTLKDDTRVEITVTKTGPENGTIRERRWRKGTNPTTENPDIDKMTRIYRVRVKNDGTKLVGKADVIFRDPTVIFTLDRQEKKEPKQTMEKPMITINVKGATFGFNDKTTIYIITEKERADLREFLKNANFPELAVSP